jgi:hypothetical protein
LRIADCGLRIDRTFNLNFEPAVKQTHKSAIRNLQSAFPLPIPYSLAEIFWNFVRPVACKCAFGEINVISLFKPLS